MAEQRVVSTDVVSTITTREAFCNALADLKAASTFSYKALGEQIDRPRTTVHGWFTGRHFPYQRDNDDVERMLHALGVEDAQPWMDAIGRVRRTESGEIASNPYPGLAPYTELDSDRFFGREQLVRDLMLRLGESSDAPLIVVGGSGTGKTSVLRAGLTPALASGGTMVRYLTPGADLELTLRSASAPGIEGSVLIVDQMEELFSHGPEPIEGFVGSLADLSDRAAHIIIGLRNDFFDAASKQPWLLSGLQRRQVVVSQPGIEVVPDLIVGPANVARIDVDPRLVAQLTQDVRDHVGGAPATGALPLLSHVLYELAEERENGRIALETYHARGGLSRALEVAAEAAFHSLDAGGRGRAKAMFAQMVELGHDAVPTRRSVGLDELEALTGEAADFEDVLAAFTPRRLIRVDGDSISISHESLLTAWSRLGGWIEEQRSVLESARRVRSAAAVWADGGEGEHMVLSGPRLDQARVLLDEPVQASRLEPTERRFITESLAAEERRRLRRRRRSQIISGLAVVSTIAFVLAAVFAIRASRESDRAQASRADAVSRQLALQAEVVRPTDPVLSRQIALLAYDTAPTVEALSAIADASADAPSARYLGESGPTALGVAENGSRFAFSNAVDGSITVMAATPDGGFEREFELQYEDPETDVYAIALSPDGQYLVSGGTDLFVSLWDLDGAQEPLVLDDALTFFELPIQSLAFAPDGRTVFGAGTSAGGVGVWDITDDPAVNSRLIPATGSTMGIDADTERGLLAAASLDGMASLWDLDGSGDPIWELDAEGGAAANSVDISPNGDLMAFGYRSGVFRVFDISDLDDIVDVSPSIEPFATWVNTVRFSRDGDVLTAGSDAIVRVWDTSTWNELGDLSEPTVVTNIRFLDDDRALVAVADGSVRTARMDDLSLQPLDATIWSTNYTPDGSLLLASSSARTTIWEVNDGEAVRIVAEIEPPNEAGFSGTNVVSPDGRWAALGSRTGPVFVLDLTDLTAPPIQVDGLAELVNELADVEGATILVENSAFSFDSSVLGATGGEGFVQLWTVGADGSFDAVAGFQLEGLARSIAFDNDEPVVAIALDNGLVRLFDISDPASPVPLSDIASGADQAYGMAFHPTEPIVATGNADKTMTVWNIEDLTAPVLLSQVTGPTSRLYDVVFDETGDRLAAAAGDRAWLWDASDPETIAVSGVFNLSEGSVYAATFSPDGETLVGAGADQRVFVWSLDIGAARARICGEIGDPITDQEWADLSSGLEYQPPCE
ncbi:MAG: hypothetical protein AAGC53_12300 [Actinomycetota bacterium]